MKKRLGSLVVGLASDCDNPETDVEKIMRAHLPDAQTLPFVAFVTHDGKWVDGFSGYKNSQTFAAIVEKAEQTPYLQASKAERKKLASLIAKSEKAERKGDWRTVVKSIREAAKTTGRCPERATLAALDTKARAWAAGQFDASIKVAQSGGDLAEARKALNLVKRHFTGEPESAEAAKGLKALGRLKRVRAAEAKESTPAGVREKAAREYEGTRWAAIFETG